MSSIEKNKINTVFQTAFENINCMTDANTVIGKPIKLDETTVILPISKITIGILSGGGEYGKVGLFKSNEDLPFSVGNGTVVSVKPYGFLIKEGNANVKFVTTEKESFEKILDIANNVISKIKL